MASSAYQYSDLRTDINEIRLIELLPGYFNDDIHIRLLHTELIDPVPQSSTCLPLTEVQKALPPAWTAYETDARYLFEKDDSQDTSWEHPGGIDPSLYCAFPETPGPDYKPKYEALSYTWGSTSNPETAYVMDESGREAHKGSIEIRANLTAFLRHLRSESSPRTIWTDAICINQSDEIEKSRQVQLMSHIYRNAYRVVIWLGPATANSKLAVSTLSYLGQQCEVDRALVRYRAPGALERDWYEMMNPLPYQAETWQAIEDFVNRDYFERLWIWQEVSLANSRALVLCGSDRIAWSTLRVALLIIRCKATLPTLSLRWRLETINPITQNRKNHSLAMLLIHTRERKCMNPRDHIYGIMSLAGPALESLVPDYTKRTAVLYEDVFNVFVQVTKRVGLLGHCDMSSRQLDMPSWVPDWSVPLETLRFSPFQLATGISVCDARFIKPGHLRVSGVRIATIGDVSEPFPLDGKGVIRALGNLQPCKAEKELDYVTGGSRFEAFLRAIRCNYMTDVWPTLEPSMLDDWKEVFENRVVVGDETLLQDAYFPFCFKMVRGRRLIWSTDGHIGLAPSSAQPGDIVCAILGSLTQIAIREQSPGLHEVVGEASLQGTDNCVTFLGPFPEGWSHIYAKRHSDFGVAHMYKNCVTGVVTEEDPRLPPLDHGWEKFERERLPDEPTVLAFYRNRETGEELNADPRLTAGALKSMGVGLETFEFV